MLRHTKTALLLSVFSASLAIGPAQAEGDAAKGELLFKRCRACHSTTEGQNKVGPSLHGVVGRKAGTAPGYKYSQAMLDSDITWSEEMLDKWLSGPKALVPGTKMIFPGFPSAEDRADVIAYLKQF